MSQRTEGPVKAFTAGEALEAFRRVKLSAASGTVVEYADAGEDYIGVTEKAAANEAPVAVRLRTAEGTVKVTAVEASAVGAVLYGGADGKVQDSSSGSAIGIALEAASGDGSIIEMEAWSLKSTTAATVSITDSGAFTAQTEVEAALQEVYQHLLSAQRSIMIPLGSLMLEDGTAIDTFSDGASATPGFSQESNKEVVLRWNNHATPGDVAFTVPLPEDLDESADVIIHALALMSGATDTPELTMEAYFNKADTDCAGTDDEIDGGTILTEYLNTIANADVPASPSALTVVLHPKDGELGTDDCLLYAVWLEYTAALLTS